MYEATRRGAALLLLCLSLVYGIFVLHKYDSQSFTRYDPGWMVRTVISFAEDRDLDLRNQLEGDPRRAADQTSRGVAGEWYPLHEYLMPVLTVPFYLLLGINGCLVFNVLVLILLMLNLYYLCLRHADQQSAFTAVTLTAFPTLFLQYSYSYSLDLFSAFVLVWAYHLVVGRRIFLAGLAWGFAVYARLSNVVTAVGFLPFLLMIRWGINLPGQTPRFVRNLAGRGSPLVCFLLGGVPAALCLLLGNWWMFGSPFITSYDRWQHFTDDGHVLSTLRSGFDCSLIERLPGVMFDIHSGLLIGAPLIVVAMGYGIQSFWRKARSEAILMLLVCLAQIALYSKFCLSFPGSPGNRYLMSVVSLLAVPLAIALRNCFHQHSKTTS